MQGRGISSQLGPQDYNQRHLSNVSKTRVPHQLPVAAALVKGTPIPPPERP